MTKTLPVTEARKNLTTLVDRASKMLDEYVVTVNGKPAAVIMSAREYEGWKETKVKKILKREEYMIGQMLKKSLVQISSIGVDNIA